MNLIARLLSIAVYGLPWLFVAVLRNISKTRRTLLRTVIGLPLAILALVMIGGLLFYDRLIVPNLPVGFWLYAFFGVLVVFVSGLILEMRPVQSLLGVIDRWLYRAMLELPPTSDTNSAQETTTDADQENPTVIVVASIATKGVTQGVAVKEAVKHIPSDMRELILRETR